jgi:hypothetical protein
MPGFKKDFFHKMIFYFPNNSMTVLLAYSLNMYYQNQFGKIPMIAQDGTTRNSSGMQPKTITDIEV